jgi:carboxyl-terminal processing protease
MNLRRRPPFPTFLLYLAVFAAGVLLERAGWLPGRPLPVFHQARGLIRDHYIDRSKANSPELEQGAIAGMVFSLGDRGHTSYLTAAARQRLKEGLAGQLDGIGVRVAAVGRRATVVQTAAGSPARAAGLRVGDVIEAVDGETVSGTSLAQLAARLRGPAGTKVRLRVLSPGAKAARELSVGRARVEVPEISWQLLPGQPRVAHLAFLRFTSQSARQLRAALEQLRKKDVRGLVLDLRGNTGGLKEQAVLVAGEFLGKGKLVLVQEDARGKREEVSTREAGTWEKGPMVVLTDGGTASAAEILAGALQHHGRARLVGTRTYGTGTVLREFPLRDGSSLLLAIGLWRTPGGRPIWNQGIEPDVAVSLPSDAMLVLPDETAPLTAERFAAMTDAQLRRGWQEVVIAAKG